MDSLCLAFADATPLSGDLHRGGFEIGWDHARLGQVPPPEHLHADSPVRQGWTAGCTAFGRRARAASPLTSRWLELRLHAWMQGHAFDTLTVTPNYLAQLEPSHCPVTRALLPGTVVFCRVRQDAAYAAGNLVALSAAAGRALHAGARREDAQLDEAGQARLKVLQSFVTPLPHGQAARLPLRVLPPNRLHLLNPIQGLQVLITRWLLRSGWSRCLLRFQNRLARLGDDTRSQAVQRFFLALLARSIGAGQPGDTLRRRWALEDAWQDRDVLLLWQRFALSIDAAQAEHLLAAMAEDGSAGQQVRMHDEEQAVDGWQLETSGYSAAALAARHGTTGVVFGRSTGPADNRRVHAQAPHHHHSR